VDKARARGAGHEVVCVSHQLPVWTLRLHLTGKRFWHDPRRRECDLASLTTFVYDGDRLVGVEYSQPAGA
jgi:broad specificity phosphatase PhoE